MERQTHRIAQVFRVFERVNLDACDKATRGGRAQCLTLLALLLTTAFPSWGEERAASREQIARQLAAGVTDFSNLVAPGVDLSSLDFTGTSLFGANLSGANLSGAKLVRCNLDVAILRDALLVNADLREASLFASVLANANLNQADLRSARLMGNFERANLEGADLSAVRGGADMRNQPMGLIRMVLTHARMQGAKLTGADLSRADLSYADLRDADLSHADLTRAKLIGADFTGAKLDKATLTGAQIDQAVFSGVVDLPDLAGTEGRETAIFRASGPRD